MATCIKCNLCDNSVYVEKAKEVFRIPCNVRKFKDDIFTLWRCSSCGSLHCKEDADLPVYYSDYPLNKQVVKFHQRIGYSNCLKLIERFGVTNNSKILDYGCGAGLFLNFLKNKGFDSAFGYDAYVKRFEDQTVLEQKYDAVVSFDVIEHFEEPRDFMRRLASVVRPGGLLMIGTPNADHVPVERKGDPAFHLPYHRHILSEKTLLALGLEQKLEAVNIYRRSFYDSPIPTVNSRFMWRLVDKKGCLDSVVEPPDIGMVLRSPVLIFLAFFGYFMPLKDNMVVTFRKL